MSLQVVVDEVLCQGHAVCESEAPEVFRVPKQGTVEILIATPSATQLEGVREAVKYCPTHAIQLKEV